MMTRHIVRTGLIAAMAAGSAERAVAQPFNDDCGSAQQVTEGRTFFDFTDATPSAPGGCDPAGSSGLADLWFVYVPSATGSATFTTCGFLNVEPGYPVTLAVYGSCGGTQLGCSGSNCAAGQSRLTLNVSVGEAYLIRLARAHASDPSSLLPGGILGIRLWAPCVRGPGAPANDCCAGAIAIGNGTFAYSTVGATRDYWSDGDLSSDDNPDVWFDYTAQSNGYAVVRPADLSAFPDAGPRDPAITVLDGTCGGDQIAVDGDFMWSDGTRQVAFATVLHHHYLIRVRSVSPDPADPYISGRLTIARGAPPANDSCATATRLPVQAGHADGTGTFAYDNTLADNSGPDISHGCNNPFLGGSGIIQDVWFRWTSRLPAGQDAVISTVGGPQIETKLAVYPDGCPVGEPLDCNDRVTPDFPFSRVQFTPTPGATYLIRIGQRPSIENEPSPTGRPGQFTITATPSCHPTAPAGAVLEPEACGADTNGLCDGQRNLARATDLPCGHTTVFGTAPVTATPDGLGEAHDLDFYRVVLPVAAHVSVDAEAEFPLLVRVYSEAGVLSTGDCSLPRSYLMGDPFASQPCAQREPLESDLTAGTYYILVVNAQEFSPCGGKNSYVLTVDVSTCEPSGRCCVPGSACQVLRRSACAAAAGAYGGDDSVCPPPGGNYAASPCGDPVEDISASGAVGPVCDDCGAVVDLGFSFSFYGQSFTRVHVSSNGFLTFSDEFFDGAPGVFVPLPSPFIKGVVAPWWDDFRTDTGVGAVYTATLGTAPNRRFVALWKNVELAQAPGTSSTFEAVLFEGTNQIAFRYGELDPAGNGHIVSTSNDGLVAAVFDRASVGPCSVLRLTVAPDPCAPCPGDFNHSGTVSVQDIFDFLSAYFSNSPSADINHSGSVTVQDIFDFLRAYFSGCP